MAESIFIDKTQSKLEQYQQLSNQLKALSTGEENWVANLANAAAVLKEAFGFFWVGFYVKATENELVLGPFQGPLACTRIRKGKGVCGTAWEKMATQHVPDVDQFPGHIACSSASKSEVVVPLINAKKEFWGVMDIDSDQLNDFTQEDIDGLELIANTVSEIAVSYETV